MALYFLSDLHLWEKDSLLEKSFIQFLQTVPKTNDVVVFGGDIFDLFISDKKVFKEKFNTVLAAIKELPKRECKTYFFEGNHDFHLKSIFEGTGVTLFTDAHSLSFEGKKIWISHGDRIHPRDYFYHMFRSFTRSPIGKFIIKIIGGKSLLHIGAFMSKTSRKYEAKGTEKNSEIKNVFTSYAKKKIREGYDYVFLGHSHIRDRLTLQVEARTGTYINLGSSSSQVRYVLLENDNLRTDSWSLRKLPS